MEPHIPTALRRLASEFLAQLVVERSPLANAGAFISNPYHPHLTADFPFDDFFPPERITWLDESVAPPVRHQYWIRLCFYGSPPQYDPWRTYKWAVMVFLRE